MNADGLCVIMDEIRTNMLWKASVQTEYICVPSVDICVYLWLKSLFAAESFMSTERETLYEEI